MITRIRKCLVGCQTAAGKKIEKKLRKSIKIFGKKLMITRIRNCLAYLPICQTGGQQHGRGGSQDPARYIRRKQSRKTTMLTCLNMGPVAAARYQKNELLDNLDTHLGILVKWKQHERGGSQDPARNIRTQEEAIAASHKNRTHERHKILTKLLNVNLFQPDIRREYYQTIQTHI